MKLFILGIFSFFLNNTCSNATQKPLHTDNKNINTAQIQRNDGLKNAYFASGCFWCVEAIYESVKGVKKVISGYAGGHLKNPTYKQVSYGKSGHAETVEVLYNPAVISFEELVTVYYASQNPTSYGQSPDFGSAYRSVIFYQSKAEKEIIETAKNKIQKEYSEKIKTEILPFQKFWTAETYHQDFETKNPNHPYIVKVSIPRLNRFKAKHPELLKP